MCGKIQGFLDITMGKEAWILIIILTIIILSIIYLYYSKTNYLDDSYRGIKQTKELCLSGGADFKFFNTGCHDECYITRSKKPISCTQALSSGCDCGPEKCWNGTSCELT